ncbi:MAG: phosphomevalonate kinase [Candidatus Aenigmarchaeota archaeon]|nr:phosphomevalonate kinase [Candidatus Aenigmarchaeota archaeon]
MHVSAPGKLFVSGEWAILEVGNPGIVAAVNKRVHAEISQAEEFLVTIDDFGIKDLKLTWDGKVLSPEGEVNAGDIKFLKASIETVLRFLGENSVEFKPFSIRTWGEDTQIEIGGQQKKIGFGSSAATVVAVVKAVLDFHGYQAGKEEIYKLSAIVHYNAQGKVGSGFDVAASTYGGLFVYKRFDAKWLVEQMEAGISLKEIVSQEWPGFMVEPLEVSEDFRLDIGWTKESASTSAMIKQLNAWAADNKEAYNQAFAGIASLVGELIPAWKEQNREKVLDLLRKNESLLQDLGQKSGVPIETADLKTLSEIANRAGGAGKLSGAGGGDCGIAVSFSPEVSEKIKQAWKEAGLYLIDATIDREGVKAE